MPANNNVNITELESKMDDLLKYLSPPTTYAYTMQNL